METRRDKKGRILRRGEDQLPDGRYRFRCPDGDRGRRVVYSWRLVPTDSLPAGKRDGLCLREKERRLAADRLDGIDFAAAERTTVAALFSRYMELKHDLKPSTLFSYNYLFNKYVSAALGDRRLSQLRSSDIGLFCNSLLDAGLKPSSVSLVRSLLRAMLALAVSDGMLRVNPAAGAVRRAGCGARRHALTAGEQEAFVGFIAASDRWRHWLPLFTFLLGTGCRIGEALGLCWEDCDFGQGMIRIERTLIYKPFDGGYGYHVSAPKTENGRRTIPMLSAVRDALLQERLRQLREAPCRFEVDGCAGFVFTSATGRPRTPGTVNAAIKRICADYNAREVAGAKRERRQPQPIRPFSPHSLRHTFCTRFCENVTDVKVLQEVMGHASVTTALNVYAEATEEKKRAAFAALEEILRFPAV